MNRYHLVLIKMLVDRDGSICQICGESITLEECTIDHIIPTTKGGTDDHTNLQVAHHPCNASKNNRILKGFIPRPSHPARSLEIVTPNETSEPIDECITITGAALWKGLTRQAIRNAVKKGKIRIVGKYSDRTMLSRADVQAYQPRRKKGKGEEE